MALSNDAGSTPSAGGAEAHTFASYLELRKDPDCLPPVVMHPALLRPARCLHCGRLEDLRPARLAVPKPSAGEQTVSSPDASEATVPVDVLALEGRTCLRCAEEIYEKTRHLQEAALEGSGGDTPLHHATRSRNLRMFCHLITLVGEERGHGVAVHLLRKRNERGETALHVAVSAGDCNMVELMLWVDPQLGQIACHDTSPIYLAVSLGHKDIAQALHEASGQAAVLSYYSGPNGQNVLHAAVLQGEEMTKKVLAWKMNHTKQKDKNGSTPLHFAVSVRQRPFIRVFFYQYTSGSLTNLPTWHLLDADSSMAYQPDNEGLFPVHIAAMTNRIDAVDILLRRSPGCMGLRDKQGRTFLHVAVQNEEFRVVRFACRRPVLAPVMNIQDNNGNTALHLAVGVENLGMVRLLLMNREVCLNLRNNKGQTALDVAKSKIRRGFFFAGNPDKVIYDTLVLVRTKHGSHRWDHLEKKCVPQLDPRPGDADNKQVAPNDLTKEESDKLTSSTQVLGIGSALIATVTFGATFALPGGYKADDHPNGGTPTLAGRWYFDAFMVANTLAFICSSVATCGLMYSGTAMVTLRFRRAHYNISLFFAVSSITSLTAAFALGVYMVLAPVARSTAITICAISPLVSLYRNAQSLWQLALVSGPLCVRRGFPMCLIYTVRAMLFKALSELWPLAVTFGWAAHLRDRRHG